MIKLFLKEKICGAPKYTAVMFLRAVPGKGMIVLGEGKNPNPFQEKRSIF